MCYPQYPEFSEALKNRYMVYNETLEYINDLEHEGKAFVLRPDKPVEIKRLESNTRKLSILYNQGYADAQKNYDDLIKWMQWNIEKG